MAGIKSLNGETLDLSPRVRSIPGDLEETQESALNIYRYDDYVAMWRNESAPMSSYDLLKTITKIEQQRFNLETIGNAFTPISVLIGTKATQILPPNKDPRGYLFLNPSQTVTGITTTTNMLIPAVRGAGTVTSAPINVQTFRTSRFFLNITAAPATLSINILTQDPQSGLFAVAQTNIFAGVVGIGTYYVDAGEIGTDNIIEIQAVVTGAANNFSVTMISKEAYGATVAPPGVFLGNANVTTAIGYPILGGQEKKFLLLDNTPLFGVALAATTLSVFQLQ